MLFYLTIILACAGSGLLVGLTSISWWFFVPIWIGGIVVLNGLYLLIILVSTPFLPKGNPMTHPMRFSRWNIRIFLNWLKALLRVSVRVTGQEQFPEGGFILVSNHLSDFDPMLLMAVLRRGDIAYISKESNFKIPIIGPYIRTAGFLAIDRENPMRAMRTIKTAAEMVASEQMIMGIYPEGTRSKTGKLLEFKEGAFLLAKRADAPIVVMVTKGTDEVSKRTPWRRSHVEFNVLEVVDRETVKALSLSDLCAHVRETIVKGLD